jgi:hypothetical protein
MAFDPAPGPFIALMGLGFLIGTIGHIYKKPWLIGTGIALVFVATLLLPLGLHLSG